MEFRIDFFVDYRLPLFPVVRTPEYSVVFEQQRSRVSFRLDVIMVETDRGWEKPCTRGVLRNGLELPATYCLAFPPACRYFCVERVETEL